MKRFILFCGMLFLSSTIFCKPVLISFDGSCWLDMWTTTLDFAKQENIKFTYFISAPYFISESQTKDHPYWALSEIGKPLIQIRKDRWKSGTDERWDDLNRACAEGHDIASHLCGHYDGSKWTYEQWMKEMDYFRWSVNTRSENKPSTNGFNGMASISGIRAPFLAVNKAFFKAAKDFGFSYDSSAVYGRPNEKYGFDKEVPIRQIEIEGATKLRYILPFDCNFTEIKEAKHLDMEKVYFDSLCNDYLKGPSPMLVCLHFEKVPGDPYLHAMEHFVKWVKDKDPQFMTYKQYMGIQ